MSNSLRDALTKAGMVSTSKAKNSDQQAKQQARQELHAKRTGVTVLNEVALAAAKVQEEKLARDREISREREAAVAMKAARAQARQMLRERMRNDDAADLKFNFVEGNRISHIYVTAPQRAELTKGQLVVVSWGERHYLVPTEVADKVGTLIPDALVYRHESDEQHEKQTIYADDPYAAYQIPDDLMW